MLFANATTGTNDFRNAGPFSTAAEFWVAARNWLTRVSDNHRRSRAAKYSAPIDTRLLMDIGYTPAGDDAGRVAEQNEWRQ